MLVQAMWITFFAGTPLTPICSLNITFRKMPEFQLTLNGPIPDKVKKLS